MEEGGICVEYLWRRTADVTMRLYTERHRQRDPPYHHVHDTATTAPSTDAGTETWAVEHTRRSEQTTTHFPFNQPIPIPPVTPHRSLPPTAPTNRNTPTPDLHIHGPHSTMLPPTHYPNPPPHTAAPSTPTTRQPPHTLQPRNPQPPGPKASPPPSSSPPPNSRPPPKQPLLSPHYSATSLRLLPALHRRPRRERCRGTIFTAGSNTDSKGDPGGWLEGVCRMMGRWDICM